MKVIAWPAFANRELNAYTWLLYSALARKGVHVEEFTPRRLVTTTPEIIHLHWPEMIIRHGLLESGAKAAALLSLLGFARRKGARVVWTVHNLRSHDQTHPRLEDKWWDSFTRQVDGYISLSSRGQKEALVEFPSLSERPGFVIPHGHYRDIYPHPASKAETRRELGLSSDAKVVAFVGRIRPYKDVPRLLNAFRELAGSELRLVIAGAPSDESLAREIRELASRDARVALRLELLSDTDLGNVIRAADLIALPYREVLNSGTALLALSLNRPVMVPNQGSMAELQESVGPRWLSLYDGTLRGESVRAALTAACAIPTDAKAPLEEFSWERIAGRTLSAYAAIARSATEGRNSHV
jgi:glycosyltransferase involved in cell wall biosynthesis